MTNDELTQLLMPFDSKVRELAVALCELVGEVESEALVELDFRANLIGFTFMPGTYRGLFAAVSLQRSYVNLMFSRGVEISELDTTGMLEGTGKKARHIKFRDRSRLADPEVRKLIAAAAEATPRT